MMTAASPLFLDTNILIYASDPTSPWHAAARTQIRAALHAGRACCINPQVIREYYSTHTRAPSGGTPPPLTTTITNLAAFQRACTVLDDTRQVVAALLTLVQTIPVGGRQIHDANLVATMLAYGVGEILTHNVSDFKRFAGVSTVTPLVAVVP